MILHQPTCGTAPRRGVVLLAVLVVVVLLSLAAYQFSELMMAEYKASDSYVRSAQARAYADSGVHYLAATLANPETMASTLNNNPYNNPTAFQGIVVDPNAAPRLRGQFSIFALLSPDDPNFGTQGLRPGVEDEGGKINLNALLQWDPSGQKAHDILLAMNLPNLTEDVINSILDWLDPDQTERSNGAEDTYYGSLPQPYHTKNGPLDSLDELLLVKGVTPLFLYGNDRNRNGIVDPEEAAIEGTGTLDRGWSAYFTVYSREPNVNSQGNPRIYINSNDLNTLYNNLQTAVSTDMANFILACRQYGYSTPQPAGPGGQKSGPGSSGPSAPSSGSSNNAPKSPSPAPSGGASSSGTSGTGGANAGSSGGGSVNGSAGSLQRTTLTKSGGGNRITSLYDLINAQVSVPSAQQGGPATIIKSPLQDQGTMQQLLPVMFDMLTTTKSAELPPRINVNTAPQAILQALPGLSDTDVQNILTNRPSPASTDAIDPMYQSPLWLITQANISPTTLSNLDRYITTRSQVYRAQVVGYFDNGGPVARYEVVIDGNQGYPRVLYQRDLSELGKEGLNLNPANP
jgi:type II secretory pathway component PulK